MHVQEAQAQSKKASPDTSSNTSSKVYESEGQKFRYETLVKRGDVIWGFDFLPDGRIIFTERGGTLGVYDPKTNKAQTIQGAPQVWAKGQGGLLDVRVQASSAKSAEPTIYLTYSEPKGKGATTALGVGVLSGQELKNFKKIFSAEHANTNEIHFGSRIEFDNAGHIFVTIGDRNDRHEAQKLNNHIGSVVRLKEDGSAPSDNPFVGQKEAAPEVWSYGHRSPQGLVRHPTTGDLWLAEMGPRGGDEINLVKKGANYGWPLATYGREYWGPSIGEKTKAGTEPPVVYWVPSISPSGMTIYNGDVFPKWKGNAFIGNLSSTHLRRLAFDEQAKSFTRQEELLKDLGERIRNVRPGPDGFLYLSTDSGQIARLTPASN